MDYVEKHHGPLDLFFKLAKDYQTVLLNGSGFEGPPWSVRVSLANLDDKDYVQIGKNLAEICHTAADTWRKSGGGKASRSRK
jgi:aspartate 4-decarboxylase